MSICTFKTSAGALHEHQDVALSLSNSGEWEVLSARNYTFLPQARYINTSPCSQQEVPYLTPSRVEKGNVDQKHGAGCGMSI